MTALKASQIHNERLTDRHSNPDIDISRSDQNITFYKTENLTEDVKRRVADIQSRQKRKIRCDAPVAIEYMITASPEAMARLSKQEQERYFAECLSFVEARHGIGNRLSAVLHLDETTPHLHMLVFPEREGKLDAKSFFKLPALTALQDEFAIKVGRQFGLERGVRLTELLEKGEKPHRHQSVAVYKAKKLKETERKLAKLEQTTADLAAIEAIEPKKGFFTPITSRVSVTQDEFKALSSQAKAYAVTKETLENRSKSLIAREKIVHSREALIDASERLSERNKALAAENSFLRNQLSTEKDKNIELEKKIRGLAVYANDRKLLEDTRSQLAKEKEERKKAEKQLETAKRFYSQMLEGIHLVAEKYLSKLIVNNKRICTLPIQELARLFVDYFRENREQDQQKQVNRQQNGPER